MVTFGQMQETTVREGGPDRFKNFAAFDESDLDASRWQNEQL